MTVFKILAPFGGQNGLNIKLLILWLKEFFSRVKFYADYVSVIRNAEFIYLCIFYMLAYGNTSPKHPKITNLEHLEKSKLLL